MFVLLVAVSACASTKTADTPAASTSSGPSALTVTMTRTGGFAGNRDRVVIGPDGAWTRTGKSGTTTTGRLATGQVAQLQQLAAAPEFAGETTAPSNPACADAYAYSVSAGTATIAYTDCGAASPPVAAQIVALISGWVLT